MTAVADLPDACRRVLAGAEALSLDIEIMVMGESTRTAEDAARACGCTVAEIAKSLVFVGRNSGEAYLLLVSGANRVDQEAIASVIGEPLDRAPGRLVRDVTGFAIGGIPPFGHARRLRTLIDAHLLTFEKVWAAAGTPLAVFRIASQALKTATEAVVFTA